MSSLCFLVSLREATFDRIRPSYFCSPAGSLGIPSGSTTVTSMCWVRSAALRACACALSFSASSTCGRPRTPGVPPGRVFSLVGAPLPAGAPPRAPPRLGLRAGRPVHRGLLAEDDQPGLIAFLHARQRLGREAVGALPRRQADAVRHIEEEHHLQPVPPGSSDRTQVSGT